MKILISGVLIFITMAIPGQKTSRTVLIQVLDEVSTIPIENATVIFEGSDGSRFRYKTDSLGCFRAQIEEHIEYMIQYAAKGYLTDIKKNFGSSLVDTVLKIYLSPLEQGNPLPEFIFLKDSVVAVNASIFEDLSESSLKRFPYQLKIIGNTSPDEADSIARLRAEAILAAFVESGANSQTFTIEARPGSFPTLKRDYKIDVNGKDVYIKKETKLSQEYLENANQLEREAIHIFMRRVQLEIQPW